VFQGLRDADRHYRFQRLCSAEEAVAMLAPFAQQGRRVCCVRFEVHALGADKAPLLAQWPAWRRALLGHADFRAASRRVKLVVELG